MTNFNAPGLWISASLLLLSIVFSGTLQGTEAGERSRQQTESVELLSRLVSFRTAQGHDQVLPMARFLADEFLGSGFDQGDVHLLPMKDVAALVVRFSGPKHSANKPILFMAHMDVVDASKQDWHSDPYQLLEKDGYFYGRGVMDNKAGVANLATAFMRLRAEGYQPNRDLIIAFSGDEETTGYSFGALLNEHRQLIDAEYALNSDSFGSPLVAESSASTKDSPSRRKALSFDIQTAEKSYITFALETSNPGGHSSQPRADNAIYELATALTRLAEYRFPARSNETTRLYFERSARLQSGELSAAMADFAKDPQNQAAGNILANNPRYLGMTRTTCVSTMLKAGHAENALPQSAVATVNCRVWPDESAESVRQRLETAIDMPDVKVRLLNDWGSSPASPLMPDLISAIEKTVGKRHPDILILPYMAPYGTDGAFTRRAGIPTYGVGGLFLGPDDFRAHGVNERVPTWSFFEAQDYWYDLIRELSGSGTSE